MPVGTVESDDPKQPEFAFPVADFSSLAFTPISPTFIPRIEVPFIDPITRTQQVGAFNTSQFLANFPLALSKAKELTQVEFEGLRDFNRQARQLQQEGIISENAFNQIQVAAANIFNRPEIAAANQFNQAQRTAQLEKALPGARDIIQRQIERGAELAEGGFPLALEDRAFEVAARNAAAEGTVARGFGDDSVFGRRASDLLSAQQRLQLSQVGEQTLDRFLTLGANLAFDQPIKFNPILFEPQQARTAQDVRGAPAIPTSQLAAQQQALLTQLTSIAPAQAISFDIGQNQFQANLDRSKDVFNSQLDFNAQAFNSEGALKVQLEKLFADVFNAQQEASAINQSIGAGIAQSQFEAAQDQAQDSAILGAIGEFGGAAAGAFFGGGFRSTGTTGGLGREGAQTIIRGTTLPASGGGAAGTGAAGGGGVGTASAGAAPAAPVLVSEGVGGGVAGGGGAGVGGGASVGGGAVGGGGASVGGGAAGGGGAGVGGGASVGGGAVGGAAPAAPVLLESGVAGSAPAAPVLITETGVAAAGETTASAAFAQVAGPLTVAAIIGLGAHYVWGVGKSGKGGAQQTRDQLRDHGEDIGAFFKPDPNNPAHADLDKGAHYVELADGSFYNIGTDGDNKLQNHGVNIDGKRDRLTYEIDWSDPRSEHVVAMIDPIATMFFGEAAQYMTGHLTNAVMSNTNTLSGVKQNIRKLIDDVGLDYETGLSLLSEFKDSYNHHVKDFNTRLEAGGVQSPDRFATTTSPTDSRLPPNRKIVDPKKEITDEQYTSWVNSWSELMLTQGVPSEITV